MSEELRQLVTPHIDSYDFFAEKALSIIVAGLPPVYINNRAENADSTQKHWRLKFKDVTISKPIKSDNRQLFPTESRQSGTSYSAPMVGTVALLKSPTSDEEHETYNVQLGNIPVMVNSSRCHLRGLTSAQLVKNHEEELEVGGYFIINGNEKVMRMLVANKANHPIALTRQGWTNRGPGYTKFGVTLRSVRPDRSSLTNNLHYISDGQITFRFYFRRQEYFIPVTLLLKALVDTTDKEIFTQIVQGDFENTFLTDRVELTLREQKVKGLNTKDEILDYIGSRYRHKANLPDSFTNQQIAEYMIDNFFLVHLPDYRDKFNILIVMIQKLYAVVQGKNGCDNIDATSFHEVLLPERLTEYLEVSRAMYLKAINAQKTINEDLAFKKAFDRSLNIGEKFNYFLATGNLVSSSGLDLQQTSGFAIIADKLNFIRYISHFRSIHRGAFFATMKTTSIRKLMPESFGFLCPVHTPDGAPCGLLNHLSANCIITKDPSQDEKSKEGVRLLPSFLMAHGVTSIDVTTNFQPNSLPVMLNGKLIGRINDGLAQDLVDLLRYLKSTGDEKAVPQTMEVAYAPKEQSKGGQYPGIFLFTTGARFMRTVINLKSGKNELIGPQEQLYMNISIMPEEVRDSTTHCELSPTAMFSVEANLTPFSDYNQSPRNMYQCQMAKQTMGTPLHSYAYRTDNKLYKVQNIQRPIVATENQSKYRINDYPHGCNAVIAVVSNTGYDMEDAMIINKSAFERGFGHGSVYKNEFVDIDEGKSRLEMGKTSISRPNYTSDNLDQWIDRDGLPYIGRLIKPGEPYYTVFSTIENKQVTKNYKGKEDAWIEEIMILGGSTQVRASTMITKFVVKLRFDRNPVIGDKFSSRHGQKGVLSQLWPEINMPFTESGLKPDVIINPNAFPSRMTIGMLVEILAAKAGAIHGKFQDATAFRFNEKNSAVEFFGEQLKQAGFNYYGNEPMYSGTTGEEFHANIFFGICYYQRLRHMVKDKYQVRATGRVNNITRQPIKGRKVGGGIRFGEMERDSLLAHGTSFCLNDRLMKSSDYCKATVCKQCGSTTSVAIQKSNYSQFTSSTCITCKTDEHLTNIALPYVFTYLIAELASVNISLKLQIK
ncbi:RNA polymerase I [Heterostelium album PN500]|uniref:DNA-directed RNA polymerase subunit beta n=1 Tax=Heterostelium pallidum (strain ATCC 26659 / Pp 5 / PN500) TaxID=670386 RepID=D3B127_HETP5|nr:RNA polymerase I [Heterostelium album PN500]EFA85001.1 RNA polymerase I [Heterostelium album PN500]|eukprot:XP_020437111.1 RNA polymerase I [Heterostelium album PN500]